MYISNVISIYSGHNILWIYIYKHTLEKARERTDGKDFSSLGKKFQVISRNYVEVCITIIAPTVVTSRKI